MRMTLLTGIAAFTLTAAPAMLLAQETANPPQGTMAPVPAPTGTTTVTTTTSAGTDANGTGQMTVQQRTTYATWPTERRSQYDAWPIESQTYYWTLAPEQQEGYWALTDDQRGQVYNMSPEQQALAWQSIRQQLSGQTPSTPPGQANPPGAGVPTTGVPNPQTANQAARPAMPATQSYQGGPYKGALTPPPADAMNKDYPVCSTTVTDGCRNRGGK